MLRLLVMTLVISMLYLPSNTEEASVEVNTTTIEYCKFAWNNGVARFKQNNLCSECFNQKKTEEKADNLDDGESRTVFLKLFEGELAYIKGKDGTCRAEKVLMVKVWTCKNENQKINCKLDKEKKRCTFSFKEELDSNVREPIIKIETCEDADLCNDPDSKKTIFEWNHICTASCCPMDNEAGPLRASLTLKEHNQLNENVVLIPEIRKPDKYQLVENRQDPRFTCRAKAQIKHFWICSNLLNNWTPVNSPKCVSKELNVDYDVEWNAKTGLFKMKNTP